MPERIVVVGQGGSDLPGTRLANDVGTIARRSNRGSAAMTFWGPIRSSKISPDWSPTSAPGSTAEDPSLARLEVRSIHFRWPPLRGMVRGGTGTGPLRPGSCRRGDRLVLGGQDLFDVRTGQDGQAEESGDQPLCRSRADHQPGGRTGRPAPWAVRSERRAGERLRLGGTRDRLGGAVPPSGRGRFAHLCGGESAFTPPIVNGFATMKALFPKRTGDRVGPSIPRRQAVPSASTAPGSSWRKGAGMVVLATESAHRRLGLKVLR